MKLPYNYIFLLLFIQLGFCALKAQPQAMNLTLDDCRHMAVEQNMKLRNAKTSVSAASETSKEAFTNYFPTLSASGLAYNANKGLIEMETGPDEKMSLLKDGVLGGVTLTQPVFAGGQIVNGNKLARVGEAVSRLQQEQTRKEVLLTVEKYYWQIVSLTEKKHTLATVNDLLSRICKEVQAAVDAGLTTRNDLLQVQLRQNDIESSMLNLDNGLKLSRMVLAQYIGLNGEEVDVVPLESLDSIPAFPSELLVDYSAALLNTPEYQLLENNVKASKLQQKIEVGKNMPTVGVGVGYMYDNLNDKDHPFGIAFVSASVPISGWWGGSHAIKRQKANVAIAKTTATDASELLVINMQHLWNNVEDAYQQMQIAQKAIAQSTENLRLNENYYKAGMTTMSDLLDAQSLFQQSRDKWVDTYSNFQLAKLEYRQATAQD
jgi:outer membrane protein TolC